MIPGPLSYRDFRETGPWTVYPKQFFPKENRLPETSGPDKQKYFVPNKIGSRSQMEHKQAKTKGRTKMKYMYEQQYQTEAEEKRKLCPRDTWNVEYAKQGSSKTCKKTK